MALMISIMNQLLRSGVPADATECATSCGNLLRNTGHEDIERQTLDTLSFIARDETVRVALPVIDEVFSIQFRTFDQPTIELANEVSGTVVSCPMMEFFMAASRKWQFLNILLINFSICLIIKQDFR